MAKKMTMHVITGTHWDREWRHTAEQSKLRLMDLIDSIIDILDKDPEYNSFVLDGGAIVLEDYFTVRPEMKEKVKSLIEAKKLFIVSWYTLPETYTVAPEALIRNLQIGTEMAKEYGGAMRAGYTATGYGQTSQLPQIYEGFGIKTAMFYRGTNKYELPPLFKWEAKDGTQIFVHKTCDEVTRTNWYFYVYDLIALGKGTKDLSFNYDKDNVPVHLCDNVLYEKAVKQTVDIPTFDNSEEGLKKALENITAQEMQYKIGNHLLALNMEDNAEPHPLHTQMVNAMNSVSEDIEIIQDDMDSYMDTIIEENKNKDLHVHRGELRYEAVDFVELSAENIKMSAERRFDTATAFSAVRRRLLISVDIPMLGYNTYALRLREPEFVYKTEYLEDRKLIGNDYGTLENEYLKITLNSNGTFTMLDKKTGKEFKNMHYFTDEGQVGSAHKYITPVRNSMITSHGLNAKITLKENNELRAAYKVEMEIPAASTLDGRDRLRETVTMPIMYELTLEKGCPYLKVHTKLTNKARNHKLYVNFPTGIMTNTDYAESAFAVEERSIRHKKTLDNVEPFAPCHPMQNFCGVSDGKNGLAFFSGGLREYEIRDDKNRTIAITLLRTQRAYMTANPEEFDRYTGLHSFGELEYNYALYPHTGNWEEGNVQETAYDFKVGMKAIQGVPVSGELPSENSFITIDNDKIVLAAIKCSECKSGYIIGLWNKSDEDITANISINLPVTSAKLVKLNEEKISDIDMSNGKISVPILGHKIITIKID